MALPPFLAGEDLLKFRTRHCERFVKQGRCHFGEKCQYSHDLEWTRRPLWKYNYAPQLCHFVHSITNSGTFTRLQHTCCLHRQCPLSHSREEQMYHPKVYKRVLCERFMRSRCPRYYCPFAHGVGELQGPSPTDSTLQELAHVPQDVLSPVPVIPYNINAALSFTTQIGTELPQCSSTTSKRLHFETVSECTTSSGGTPSSTLSIQRKHQLPHLPYETSAVAFHKSETAEQSLDSIALPSPGFASGRPSVGRVHLTPTIMYDAESEKSEEAYIPLDSISPTIFVTQYEGFLKNTQMLATPLRVYHIKSVSLEDMKRFRDHFNSLADIRHPNLTPIYLVHTSSKLVNFSDKSTKTYSEPSDLWIAIDIPLPQRFPGLQLVQQFSFERFVSEPLHASKGVSLSCVSLEKIFAVLRGLKALHSSKLRHGHLTPSVIEMNKATGEIRLGNILRGVFPVSLSHVTLPYLVCQSPEILGAITAKNSKYIEEKRTCASDVWSAGICLFVWLNERKYVHPFGEHPQTILENVIRNRRAPHFVELKHHFPLLYHLLCHMLNPDPASRITIEHALEHPLFWKQHDLGYYINLLCTFLRIASETSETLSFALTQALGWMDDLCAMMTENRGLPLEETLLLMGTNAEDQLQFILQSLGRLDMMHGPLPLLEVKEHVAAVYKAIGQQSGIGLLYFFCLLLTDDRLETSIRHQLAGYLVARYTDLILAAYDIVLEWKRTKTQHGVNVPLLMDDKTTPRYFSIGVSMGQLNPDNNLNEVRQQPLYGSTRRFYQLQPSTLCHVKFAETTQSQKASTPSHSRYFDQSYFFPPKEEKCTEESASYRISDTMDGESTTTSSVSPYFVQSLLSFMVTVFVSTKRSSRNNHIS